MRVWNVAIPMGSGGCAAGGPTVRKADIPSGQRMTREANAGGRKAAGNRGRWLALLLAAADNRPDRDCVLA